MPELIRVLLADDYPVVRAGLRAVLCEDDSITVVGEAENGDEVQRLCAELCPDLLLLDVNMPGRCPEDIINNIRKNWPSVKVLVIASLSDDAHLRSLVAAGASGSVLKDEAVELIRYAVQAIMHGGVWFSQHVVTELVFSNGHNEEALACQLSQREHELLHLIAQDKDIPQIASELKLAQQTVRNYTSRLYSKLGVNSRSQAIILAHDRGLTAQR